MLFARGDAYKKAIKNEGSVKAKKEALLEEVRKAERRDFELLMEIQGILVDGCSSKTTSRIGQSQIETPVSIPKKSKLPIIPPTTKNPTKNHVETTPKAPLRDRIID
jgi:hypothetical protein